MNQLKIKPHPLSQFELIVMGFVISGFGLLGGGFSAWGLLLIPIGLCCLLTAWYNVASKTYLLSSTSIIVRSGVFSLHTNEVEFFRIKDILVFQSFIDRFFDIGSITIISSDPVYPALEIYGIEHPESIGEFLREAFHQEREKKNVNFVDLFQNNIR